jgi:hypothetical protein
MTKTTKLTKGVAAGLTAGLAMTVTACGSSGGADPTAAYCAALKAARTDLVSYASTTANPDLSRFHVVAGELADIAAKAPTNIAPVWNALSGPITAFDHSLTAAGTTMTAYVTAVSQGKAPAGVTPAQIVTMNKQLAALQDPRIRQAGQKINADALKTCSLDLTKTS